MIVGTAGHIDHGKTTLVRVLTGVDTDRLKEEKARGITIDLGFAYMLRPEGDPIGFIDVPGHEKLVRTMMAGAAGIDFVLLVVAADEGVKPQTREHIEILRLLGIEHGLVVVSKSDRADEARRRAVLAEIGLAMADSPLVAAPPLFVSAATGEGLDSLRERLFAAASRRRRVHAGGCFRLAVDRVFQLKGIGTIAAGTAISGRVAVDTLVTIMPGRVRCRVRSLHVQNRPATEGHAGERCALALVGVARDAISRGAWICGEVDPPETSSVDVELRLSPGEAKALGQGMPIHLHCGASDVPARVSALSPGTIAPGGSGFARIALATPLPLRHSDRLVLRDTSARRTFGGALVFDTRAPPRRRRSPDRLHRLSLLRLEEPARALAALLATPPGFEDLDAFTVDRSLIRAQADALVAKLDLLVFNAGTTRLATTRSTSAGVSNEICHQLAEVHAAHPEQPGLAVEDLRTRLANGLSQAATAAVVAQLVADGRLAQRGHWLHLPGHAAQLSAEERRIADLVLPLVEGGRFQPPRVRELGAALMISEAHVRAACKALVRRGTLVEVAKDHFFRCETVAEMAAIACRLTEVGACAGFSAAEFRDQLVTGRKLAVQILEFFDRHGVTIRRGDMRFVEKKGALMWSAENHDSRPAAAG